MRGWLRPPFFAEAATRTPLLEAHILFQRPPGGFPSVHLRHNVGALSVGSPQAITPGAATYQVYEDSLPEEGQEYRKGVKLMGAALASMHERWVKP